MQYTQLSRRSAGGKIDWEKQYLTFIPVEDAVFTWAQRAVSGHLEYSVNGGQTWVMIANGESTPTITACSKVMWRGDLRPNISFYTAGIGTFSANANYHAYGNTMSLLFYDNYYGRQLAGFLRAFTALFLNDSFLVTAPELPATTLGEVCYYQMFKGCTALTTAPELPALTLAQNCYSSMFYGCTSLTTAPTLPATILKQACYQEMFQGCTGLTSAPALPATTLANYCYQSMFSGCVGLITAPALPATTLVGYCYQNMFKGCTGLTTAPELPATTLATSCYSSMFQGCTSLNYIKCLATDISATKCLTYWVSGVASTGTFVKDATMTGWTTGTSGIPSGWTVVDDNS